MEVIWLQVDKQGAKSQRIHGMGNNTRREEGLIKSCYMLQQKW